MPLDGDKSVSEGLCQSAHDVESFGLSGIAVEPQKRVESG